MLTKLLDETRKIAVSAGEAILAVTDEDRNVREKADGSPLTRADTASNRVIHDGLEKIDPLLPIVSEESDPQRFQGQSLSEFWLVDPLDGTKEFVKGLNEYTVNIALVENSRPVLGVVYAPALNEMYSAAEGLGAWKQRADTEPKTIQACKNVNPITAVVSRSHLSEQTEQFLKKLKVENTIKRGSSLKICALAEGAADVYPRFGPTSLWDSAAGTAVAREAGCVVTKPDGSEMLYDLTDGLLVPGFIVCSEAAFNFVRQHIES
jgi:3'(2'), 5'-bisphosphate nucleotidase